ncbi:helix-turn-helix domain-containing protein [Deinococcus navajonensis]|uniref:Helix-turn-helix domain-containing protein n=1 Tax=Deinococcus navajonensis TaxID=309884 RepID=A0ABV8XGK4_9DEIO
MDAKQAGKLMQGFRKRKGLTQDQVVEQSTVPTPQYLSALENGRYDVRNSEHFKSLVNLYGLTHEEIIEVNPDALISVAPPTQRKGALVQPRLPEVEVPLEIPDALKEAIRRYSDDMPEMRIEANVRAVSSLHRYGGANDLSPMEWFEVFSANRRWLVKPDGN